MDLDQDKQEIKSKIEDFYGRHSQMLADLNKFYKMYRSLPTKTRRENQSNTFLPEMFVEIEAIATAVHEMVLSDNSRDVFFDVLGEDGGLEDLTKAIVTKAAISKQMEIVEFQPKLLPFIRLLALYGTMPVNLPWRLDYKSYWDRLERIRKPAYDCWDFVPVNPLNFAFDDSNQELEKSSWSAETVHVPPSEAMAMLRNGIWDQTVVDESMKSGLKRNTHDSAQRQLAGYLDESGKKYEGITAFRYYGTLESRGDGETYWADLSSNGDFLKEPEINPYSHGEKEWLMAKWFDIGEPYGMGIGHINWRTQSEINDRRNFINDLLYASLYAMWLKRSDAGISLPGNKMSWAPHKIIEGDGITDEFIRAIRPDLAALSPAVSLENQDIEKMRRHSGATSTLQAVATGITATEAQSIQSEATRRLKAMVRANVAAFLRKFLYRIHALNLQFMDRPLSARVTNSEGYEIYGSISRQDLLINPDIRMRLSADLDFRPFKRKELLEMLDIFSRLEASGMLGARKIIPDPIIEELAATYGMDPRKFFGRDGIIEAETRRAMLSPQNQARAAREMAQEAPGGGFAPAALRATQTGAPLAAQL